MKGRKSHRHQNSIDILNRKQRHLLKCKDTLFFTLNGTDSGRTKRNCHSNKKCKDRKKKRVYNRVQNRLFPKHMSQLVDSRVSSLKKQNRISSNQTSLKKRIQIAQNFNKHQRTSSTDQGTNDRICSRCNIGKVMDINKFILVCPQCGVCSPMNQHMNSYTFKTTPSNRKRKTFALAHFERFVRQFTDTFKNLTKDEMNIIRNGYDQYNSHSVHMVNSSRTSNIIRSSKLTNRLSFCVDHIGRIIKGIGVPIFNQNDINKLYKAKLDLSDHPHYKSINNQQFIRDTGMRMNIQNARLFPPAKTKKKESKVFKS